MLRYRQQAFKYHPYLDAWLLSFMYRFFFLPLLFLYSANAFPDQHTLPPDFDAALW